ncbi:MAG TPA: FAD-dependent oxidoreductase [Natrialbaceae archaeon]|nr:FAD-dependent oxidoreductase [Natrialbaceae archaeon]
MTENVRDVVIAGSGVAGLSAAVYAARGDLEPLVLEGDEPGGQLTLTTDVDNFLGFPDGVGGHELVERGKEQARSFGAEFKHGIIADADLSERPFTLELSSGDTIETRAMIVASGASARTLGVPGEDDLMGFGLSTCATCDGAFHRGDDIIVVGGGDAAMEEADFLTKFADSVTVVHRREDLRASDLLARRARDNEDIEFMWNAEVTEILGSQDEGVSGVSVVQHPDGHPTEKLEDPERADEVEEFEMDVGGVFYAIGHVPNTEFLEDTPVELDDHGYLETEAGMTSETGVEGVFAAGDVMDPEYQQAITAAGTGSMAALDAEEWLTANAGEAAAEESATASTPADD